MEPTSTKYRVGVEIVTYCGRCKLSLSHVISSMNEDLSIAKVQCKTCGSHHKFKAAPSAKKTGSHSGDKKRLASKSKAQMVVNSENLWNEAVSRNRSIPYSTKSSFKKGDVIDHVQFGPGLVEQLIDRDKISVIFKGTTKILLHNR